MQKPITWPPVWRWRLTLPEPWTLRTLIQRPVARSNLKGLNQTRSPCGTHGSSSLCMAWSGRPRSEMTCSVCSCVMNSPPVCDSMFCYSASRRLEVEDSVRVAADLLDLRYDLAVQRSHVGPVDLDKVARRVPQIHLDSPVWQLPDCGVASAVPHAEFLGLRVRGLEVVNVEREVMPLRSGIFVQEEVELQITYPQPAHRPGEVGRGDLLHPEEVRVEADRLLQVGGADTDVGEPSRPHVDAPTAATWRRSSTTSRNPGLQDPARARLRPTPCYRRTASGTPDPRSAG